MEKPELGTAAVVSTDLERLETFRPPSATPTRATSSPAAGGIVTRVPGEGAELSRGDSIMEIDGRPVLVFYGERPMWRPVGPAPDGFGDGRSRCRATGTQPRSPWLLARSGPDQVLDEDTVRLIRDWRSDAGLDRSDTVELGRILYVEARSGWAAVWWNSVPWWGPAIRSSRCRGNVQEVRMEFPVDRRDRISVGGGVAVRLPDDVTTTGTVQEIGSVVFTPSRGS